MKRIQSGDDLRLSFHCSNDLSITIRSKTPTRNFLDIATDFFPSIVYRSDLCYRHTERRHCDSDHCPLLPILFVSRAQSSSSQEIRANPLLSWSSATEDTHCRNTIVRFALYDQIIGSVSARSTWPPASINRQHHTVTSLPTVDDGSLPEWYPYVSTSKRPRSREKLAVIHRSAFDFQWNPSFDSLQAFGQSSVHK